MYKLAQLLSNIFQPLLFPTFSMILLFQVGNFVYFDFRYKLHTVFSIFILTAIIPLIAIFFLQKMGVVSSLQLTLRKERTVPYVFVILSYITAIFFLYRFMPAYVVAMMTGVVVSTIVIMLVNLKWKVSAHLSAMGGLCAAIIVVSYRFAINPVILLSIVFLLAGMIGTSRILLKVHTLMQTVSGFLIGFIIMFFFGFLF